MTLSGGCFCGEVAYEITARYEVREAAIVHDAGRSLAELVPLTRRLNLRRSNG